jgi:hypothetical protein
MIASKEFQGGLFAVLMTLCQTTRYLRHLSKACLPLQSRTLLDGRRCQSRTGFDTSVKIRQEHMISRNRPVSRNTSLTSLVPFGNL